MEMDHYEHGIPSWVDLGTPDPTAAAAFYGGLFGWESFEGPPEAGGYRMELLRGRTVAGIGPAMNPGPPYWTTYVTVDDADAIVPLVAEAGGAVLAEPFDVLDVGRMAVFADPQGAAFSVWQARSHPGAGLVNEPGAYCWSELVTSDVEAAKAFYGKVFGWGARVSDGSGGSYTEWQVSDRSVGGLMARPPGMPAMVPDHWGVYFAIADHDDAVAKVTALGGSVMMGPMTVAVGTFSVCVDPQGASFNVLQLSGARAG